MEDEISSLGESDGVPVSEIEGELDSSALGERLGEIEAEGDLLLDISSDGDADIESSSDVEGDGVGTIRFSYVV